ncbi:PREDICTED: uncharacterized protein LOC104733887 [Camelina sativa]|uniref:Uncharacterized protein LOC104733887 n=1 Tax=Camelina sativa TaxID=90675 RepID=A0ABM0V6N6_CAMSA|nr:PREDICTED: uncharacterized protein LOC104733887 [Camelina sativa]
MKLMGTMNTEYFTGGNDQVQADDWRQTLEKNLRSARCPVEFRKDLAVHFLHGDVDNWWRNVEGSLPVCYVPTWEDFLEEFNKKYFPQEAMDQLKCEFLELRHGTMTVRGYDAEFTRLRRFIGREYSEQELICRFMRGLRADIRNRCSVRGCTSMVELVEQAATVERGLEEEANDLRSTQLRETNGRESQKRALNNQKDERMWNQAPLCDTCGKTHSGACLAHMGVCFTRGKPIHTRLDCPEGRDTCHRCGRPGHVARNCRTSWVG